MKVLKLMERNTGGQTSCEAGIARRLKMKKRKKAGKKRIKWQSNGRRSKNWRESWKEGQKEALQIWMPCKKVPELVVNERMPQGKRVKSPKEKKKVPGWSIEEMKVKPNIAVEEDTEEIRKWRGRSQSEMDQCWKNLPERMEEEVLKTSTRSKKAKKERPLVIEVTPWNGGEQETGEKTAGQEFSLCSQNTTCSACKASRMSQQKRRR